MVLNTTVSAFKLAFQQVGNALTPTAPPRRDFTEARLQLARNRAKGRRALHALRVKQRHAYLDLLRLSESAAERKLLYELADRTFRCKQGPEYDHEYRDADLPPTSPYSRPHQLRDVPYMRHDALPQCSVTAYQHLHRGPTYQQPNTVSLLDNSWLRTQNTAADMFYQFAVIYFIFVAFVLLARWVVLLLRWVMMVGTRQE